MNKNDERLLELWEFNNKELIFFQKHFFSYITLRITNRNFLFFLSFMVTLSLVLLSLTPVIETTTVAKYIKAAFWIDNNPILFCLFIISLFSGLIMVFWGAKYDNFIVVEWGKLVSGYSRNVTAVYAGVISAYSIFLLVISIISENKVTFSLTGLIGLILAVFYYHSINFLIKPIQLEAKNCTIENIKKVNIERINRAFAIWHSLIQTLKKLKDNLLRYFS